MCSIITVRTEPGELTNLFRSLRDNEGVDSSGLQLRVHGFLKKEQAPVILSDARGVAELHKKYFSLCPDWAKSWPFPFETYNARLSRPKRERNHRTGKSEVVLDREGNPVVEEITHVPSFRSAFSRGQVCLVPVSGAVESCYFGESAGKIVRFSDKNKSLLFAAGLWNDWFNPQTGEFVPTFTLLTDDPDPQVFAHGHDRGIVILGEHDWETWLRQKMTPAMRLEFLRTRRRQPEWMVEAERELKPGWQKRAPAAAEIDQIKVWKKA
ncbi:MAG: hypothetical protein RI932_2214 [Pseudomonadota bacterium]